MTRDRMWFPFVAPLLTLAGCAQQSTPLPVPRNLNEAAACAMQVAQTRGFETALQRNGAADVEILAVKRTMDGGATVYITAHQSEGDTPRLIVRHRLNVGQGPSPDANALVQALGAQCAPGPRGVTVL